MKVVVVADSFGYQAILLDCSYYTNGKTFDDAIYNLQANMARMVIDAGTDNVFPDNPCLEGDWAKWRQASPTFYDRASFLYEGKPVQLPVLDVRFYE